MTRRGAAAAAVAAVIGALAAAPAGAEIGWTPAVYEQHFGAATRSPVTPDEAQFSLPGGRLLVLFAGGHSREETWLIDKDDGFVPKALRARAQAAVRGQPARHIVFKRSHAAPADIYIIHSEQRSLAVDYRGGHFFRIAECTGAQCVLLDRLLSTDQRIDDLIARTEAQMRREGQ